MAPNQTPQALGLLRIARVLARYLCMLCCHYFTQTVQPKLLETKISAHVAVSA
jgi:hypothetical protein